MSQTWNPGVEVAELTHVGMRRANNQDSYAVMVAESEDRFGRRGHLFVVADGMGAHAAGELASKIASEQIAMRYIGSQKSDVSLALVEAVHHANAAIFDRGQSNPEFHNMGTTASSLVLAQGQGYVAHVGDSRVYRFRDQALEQLTFDHSLVWEMQASGQVHGDSPLGKAIPKNVITRSLGPGAHVLVDLEGPFDLQKGDRFLLCSDGLTGLIEDDELAVLLASVPLDRLAPILVDLANLRGGPDNITVVIVEVQGEHVVGTPSAKVLQSQSNDSMWSQVNSSRALLATTVVCWLVAIGLAIGVMMGNGSLLASAIVAFLLGGIALGVWASGILAPSSKRSAMNKSPAKRSVSHGSFFDNQPEESSMAQGDGPYRHCKADQHAKLFEDLRKLVDQLRQTSERNMWMLDWTDVDRMQTGAEKSVSEGDWAAAICQQSEATLQSMVLLKKHQDDSAGDTAVDL